MTYLRPARLARGSGSGFCVRSIQTTGSAIWEDGHEWRALRDLFLSIDRIRLTV